MSSRSVSPHSIGEDAHGHVRPVPIAEYALDSADATASAHYCYGLVTLAPLTGAVILKDKIVVKILQWPSVFTALSFAKKTSLTQYRGNAYAMQNFEGSGKCSGQISSAASLFGAPERNLQLSYCLRNGLKKEQRLWFWQVMIWKHFMYFSDSVAQP